MTRAYDFTVITVITIISITIHRISVELFDPQGAIYGVASTGTQNVNGAQIAAQWHEILTVWVPLIAVGGIIAWGIIREYRRQVTTTATRAPR